MTATQMTFACFFPLVVYCSFLSFIQYVHIEGSNPGLEYHFLSPEKVEVSSDQVEWKIENWDMCSEDCAGGKYIVHHGRKRASQAVLW